jgi:hypothetical protein
MRENREVPRSPVLLMVGAGREGNASGGNPLMHDRGKSDGPVVRAGLAVLLAGGSPVGPTPSGVRSQRRG